MQEYRGKLLPGKNRNWCLEIPPVRSLKLSVTCIALSVNRKWLLECQLTCVHATFLWYSQVSAIASAPCGSVWLYMAADNWSLTLCISVNFRTSNPVIILLPAVFVVTNRPGILCIGCRFNYHLAGTFCDGKISLILPLATFGEMEQPIFSPQDSSIRPPRPIWTTVVLADICSNCRDHD